MKISSFFSPSFCTGQLTYQNSSLTETAILWILSHHHLTPSNRPIQQIPEIFNHKNFSQVFDSNFGKNDAFIEVHNRPWTIGAMKIAQCMAFLAIFTITAPIGLGWHMINSVYMTVRAFHNTSFQPKAVHARRQLFCELKWSVFSLGVFALARQLIKIVGVAFSYFLQPLQTNRFLVIPLILITLYSLQLFSFLIREVVKKMINNPLSFLMKEQLGIMADSGWLLTFKQIHQAEAALISKYFNDLYWMFSVRKILEVRSLFCQNHMFFEGTKEIISFFEDPNPLLTSIEQVQLSPYNFLEDRLQEMIINTMKAVSHAFWACELFRTIVEEVNFSTHFIFSPLPSLPFTPDLLLVYFNQLREITTQQEAEKLNNELKQARNQLKEMPALEGDETDHLVIQYKQVLEAQTFDAILGKFLISSEEECKSAYIKSMIDVNPEQVKEEWKEHAKLILLVIDGAYRSIIYQIRQKRFQLLNSKQSQIDLVS